MVKDIKIITIEEANRRLRWAIITTAILSAFVTYAFFNL